jgi:hypothetical protein
LCTKLPGLPVLKILFNLLSKYLVNFFTSLNLSSPSLVSENVFDFVYKIWLYQTWALGGSARRDNRFLRITGCKITDNSHSVS